MELTLNQKFEIIVAHHYGTPTTHLAAQYQTTRNTIREIVGLPLNPNEK